MIMSSKDINYTYVKEAYSKMSAFDLDDAGLPHVFDLLTTQQKEFFVNFFCAAQDKFRDEYDPEIEREFYEDVQDDLGSVGYDTIKSIIRRGEFKIVK